MRTCPPWCNLRVGHCWGGPAGQRREQQLLLGLLLGPGVWWGGGGAVQTATGSGASVSCPKGSVRKRTGGVPVGLSCVLVVSETPCPWDGERTELLG